MHWGLKYTAMIINRTRYRCAPIRNHGNKQRNRTQAKQWQGISWLTVSCFLYTCIPPDSVIWCVICVCVCVCRYKKGRPINKRPEFRRFKVLQQALEIRDVCKQDAGEYMLVLKNTPAALEKKLNFTLIVNGNCLHQCVSMRYLQFYIRLIYY